MLALSWLRLPAPATALLSGCAPSWLLQDALTVASLLATSASAGMLALSLLRAHEMFESLRRRLPAPAAALHSGCAACTESVLVCML